MKCSFDPMIYKDAPMGMFHCPECGEMQLAGLPHLDSSENAIRGPICEYTLTFRLKVYKDDEIVVICNEVPETVTQGKNIIDALTNAVDALEEAFAGRKRRGEKLLDE